MLPEVDSPQVEVCVTEVRIGFEYLFKLTTRLGEFAFLEVGFSERNGG